MDATIIKRFEAPDEVRHFEKGRFEVVRVGEMTLGRATYQPGWKWSVHVGAKTDTASCEVDHVGIVLAGQVMIRMDDGTELVLAAGDCFAVPPGHDSWVVGDEEYVSLHLMGADEYAAEQAKT
jgi:quercetin dioxygenase-like cupin family protein